MKRGRSRGGYSVAVRRRARPQVATGAFARLPLSLVQEHIVSFLAPVPDARLICQSGFQVRDYVSRLHAMRNVCRQWYFLIKALNDAYKKLQCRVVFHSGTKEEYGKMVRRFKNKETRWAASTQLAIDVCGRYEFMPPDEYTPPPDFMMTICWAPIVSVLPNLVRLDLFEMCLSLVDRVLPLAAQCCPQIQVLVLSRNAPSDANEQPVTHEHVTPLLVDALRSWHHSNGGLRALYIPTWPKDPDAKYDDLLAAVAAYCPRIEYLRGDYGYYEGSERDASRVGGIRCEETNFGEVSENVWAAFCANCTQLRDFTWKRAPLTLSSIHQFRVKVKPQLCELRIADVSNGTQDVPDLLEIQTMLSAVPSLVHLHIDLPDTLGRYFVIGPQNPPASPLLGSLDAFAVFLVAQCPLLESFWVNIGRPHDKQLEMTDAGLSALSNGRELQQIQSWHGNVRVTADGLLDTLRCLLLANNELSSREVRLHQNQNAPPHHAIVRLLQCLNCLDPTALATIRYELCLIWCRNNHKKKSAAAADEEDGDDDGTIQNDALLSTEQLVALYDAIKARHSQTIAYLSVSVSSTSRDTVVNGTGTTTYHEVTGIYLRVNKAGHRQATEPDGIHYEVNGYAPNLEGIRVQG